MKRGAGEGEKKRRKERQKKVEKSKTALVVINHSGKTVIDVSAGRIAPRSIGVYEPTYERTTGTQRLSKTVFTLKHLAILEPIADIFERPIERAKERNKERKKVKKEREERRIFHPPKIGSIMIDYADIIF